MVIALGLVALAATLIGPTGCDDPADRLDRIASAAPDWGRRATADELREAVERGRLDFDAVLTRAEHLLTEADPAAVLFAGATLDLAAQIEGRFPDGPGSELLWCRVGQLAYRSAFAAMADGRWAEGDSLVLAGPERWQRESYWRAYPNHDVLVAVSLGQQGRAAEGIRRLRARAVETPEMTAAIEQLRPLAAEQARAAREAERRALRERLRAGLEATDSGNEAPAGGG